MRTPHKHAEIIKAWADGAEIQFYDTRFAEPRWKSCGQYPMWDEAFAYRIKPEPKPDTVKTAAISAFPLHGILQLTLGIGGDNVRFVFDGETRKLKHVELIK